jgi:small subunit ribosomal protein S1
MSESFADMFAESLQHSETRIGEVVTAEVVRVEHNFVVVPQIGSLCAHR